MATLIATLWGLVGGFLAWFITALVGQPLYQFLALRAEAARVLALHERELPSAERRRVEGGMLVEADARAPRTKDYRACGAQLIAFATTNALLVSLFHKAHWFYPRSAGETLITLADVEVGTQAAETLQRQVMSALRLVR